MPGATSQQGFNIRFTGTGGEHIVAGQLIFVEPQPGHPFYRGAQVPDIIGAEKEY